MNKGSWINIICPELQNQGILENIYIGECRDGLRLIRPILPNRAPCLRGPCVGKRQFFSMHFFVNYSYLYRLTCISCQCVSLQYSSIVSLLCSFLTDFVFKVSYSFITSFLNTSQRTLLNTSKRPGDICRKDFSGSKKRAMAKKADEE